MWSSFDSGPLERWMEQGKLLSVGENGSSQILKYSEWVVKMEGNYEKANHLELRQDEIYDWPRASIGTFIDKYNDTFVGV